MLTDFLRVCLPNAMPLPEFCFSFIILLLLLCKIIPTFTTFYFSCPIFISILYIHTTFECYKSIIYQTIHGEDWIFLLHFGV